MKKFFILATIAGLFCLWVVKFTRIGPTILVISEERGWGIHLGDVLIVAPVSAIVLVVGGVTLARSKGSSTG